MKDQETQEINLSDQELNNLICTNRNLVLNLCRSALKSQIKDNKSLVYIKDELGVNNRVSITYYDNTYFTFNTEDNQTEITRKIHIKFRREVQNDFDNDSVNVENFFIQYNDKENKLIREIRVKYYGDGKTISYFDYWYIDEKLNIKNQAHFEKSNETIFIPGRILKNVAEHAGITQDYPSK